MCVRVCVHIYVFTSVAYAVSVVLCRPDPDGILLENYNDTKEFPELHNYYIYLKDPMH